MILPKYSSYNGLDAPYTHLHMFYNNSSDIWSPLLTTSSNHPSTNVRNTLNAVLALDSSSSFYSPYVDINRLTSLSMFFSSSDSAIVFNDK